MDAVCPTTSPEHIGMEVREDTRDTGRERRVVQPAEASCSRRQENPVSGRKRWCSTALQAEGAALTVFMSTLAWRSPVCFSSISLYSLFLGASAATAVSAASQRRPQGEVKRADINKSEKGVSLTRCVTGDLVLDGGLPGHVSGETRRSGEEHGENGRARGLFVRLVWVVWKMVGRDRRKQLTW